MQAVEAALIQTDARLPHGFDPLNDGLLLLGARSEARVRELLSLGVRKLVLLGASGTIALEPSASLPGLRLAQSPEEAVSLFLEFEEPPRNVVVERLPGTSYTQEQAQAIAQHLAHNTSNRVTFAKSGRSWVEHAFANFPVLAEGRPVAALSGLCRGRTAILVSPGPSLAKNIDVLKEAAENVVIIAGNRALRPLREHGIVPHIVLVSDPLNLRYQLDGGLLDGVQALVMDMVVHPDVAQLSAARKFFFATAPEINAATLTTFGPDSRLSGGGSVATVALSLALRLEASTIVLVGQDLALSGEQYYIPSAPDGDTRVALQGSTGTFQNSSRELRTAMADAGTTPLGSDAIQHFLAVPGYGGGTVMTSKQFDSYRTWFAAEGARIGAGARLINATEGGAHIENWSEMPLAEAVAGLSSGLALEFPAAPSGEERKQARKRLLARIDSLQRLLREADEQAVECLRWAQKAADTEGALERLDVAEKKLGRTASELPLLIAIGAGEVEAARRAGANAKNLADSLQASSRLFRVIREAALLCRPWLAQAKRSLKA